MPDINVTSDGLALVVAPAPETREVCEKVAALWRQQADVHLSVMMRNPVPKGTMK